jgi:hypothetical protein
MYEWYMNEWVHIMVIHPETHQFFYFKNGAFREYEPVIKKVNTIDDLIVLVEDAKEMETNNIVHATQENLPVYSLN